MLSKAVSRKKAPSSKRKMPPELDPVLPLLAVSRIPDVRNGEGEALLSDTKTIVIELTARSFRIMWEQAETLAKRSYKKHVDGPFSNHAQAVLEAVYAFRNYEYERVHGAPLKVYDEAKAERARQILSEHEKALSKGKRRSASEKALMAGKSRSTVSVEQENRQKFERSNNKSQKKVRCREVFEEDPTNRCLGPDQHNGKHKDRSGHKWL